MVRTRRSDGRVFEVGGEEEQKRRVLFPSLFAFLRCLIAVFFFLFPVSDLGSPTISSSFFVSDFVWELRLRGVYGFVIGRHFR